MYRLQVIADFFFFFTFSWNIIFYCARLGRVVFGFIYFNVLAVCIRNKFRDDLMIMRICTLQLKQTTSFSFFIPKHIEQCRLFISVQIDNYRWVTNTANINENDYTYIMVDIYCDTANVHQSFKLSVTLGWMKRSHVAQNSTPTNTSLVSSTAVNDLSVLALSINYACTQIHAHLHVYMQLLHMLPVRPGFVVKPRSVSMLSRSKRKSAVRNITQH